MAFYASEGSQTFSQHLRLPYGEHQGSFHGVVASSNRDDGFFSGESNYIDGTVYSGYRYQCVEYARRYLLLTTGCLFSDCDRASEIFKKPFITQVETGAQYPLTQNCNGTTTRRPEPGDIIVYPYNETLAPWGHVGIISYVDVEGKRVGLAEQNQYFGSFVSPDLMYLDGERCVSRFLGLIHDKEKGTWELKETLPLPPCFGWLSYDDAPRRPAIYKPLKPLPEYVTARSTPMDHPEHPFLCQFKLTCGIDIISGTLNSIMGARHGCGETLLGAGTATSRVLRVALQMMFRHDYVSDAFLLLPSNPLGATVTPSPCVDKLFDALRVMGVERFCEQKLVPVLAEYFGMPVEWLAAMQREFYKGELFMCCNASFDARVALDDHHKCKCEPGLEIEEDATTVLRVCNPHDEAWHLSKLSFHTLRMMAELPDINEVLDQLATTTEFLMPGYRGYCSAHYRMDFANYLKAVEEYRGPRKAFVIVLTPNMDGLQRELVATLMECCDRVNYPYRIVAEEDLYYDTVIGQLFARPNTDAALLTSAAVPTKEFEVNFVMAITEWHDVLQNPGSHQALYDAAIDPGSDVVFAKPLWSYLCSGLINHTVDDNGNTVAATSPAVKFFDIVRRLSEWAQPQQGEDTWDQAISDFADSCRRLCIALPVPQNPTANFIGNLAIVNFAVSAQMGHIGGKFVEDEFNTGNCDGQPSAIMTLYDSHCDT